ncbi:MAG: T9SS type A sorting domain-containing protein [Chitinophagales bacterium]|nr:T9SS type A sorting domain-containing protein [Bacteroidota bacterium]MBK8681036.1 T9SS type A sorting domain-containing protein [Bacteroidota bacterium]MBP9190779.1 T9SS type A sorting domain-containing protein [Chitinophagales bacterium]MBP9549792.1 T9SS type A sorting domain-containing protein [Chitinophagales bacterium]MBP9704075.1 T9SS type A sorting domain-containing protein [Chitinophagales bacterium]
MKTKFPSFYKLFFIFLLFTGSAQGFTQTPEFAPVGVKWWYYFHQYGFPPNQAVYTLEVEKDTIFLGVPCKKIVATIFNGSTPISDQAFYMYQLNDTIFASVEDSFSIVYILKPEPNDSWVMSVTNFYYGEIAPMNPTTVYVDSISYFTFFDVEFQVSHIHMEDWLSLCVADSIVELYGNPNYLLPRYCDLPDLSEPLGIKCFYHPVYGLLNFDGGECDFILEIENSEINYNIYYDILSAQIKISINNSEPIIQFTLYDLNGKFLQGGINCYTGLNIPMYEYPKGIYLLHIKTKSNSSIYKFLK